MSAKIRVVKVLFACCKVVANRTSLLTVYLPYRALDLQVRMKFGVVTEVSTFLVITQVSSGLKNIYM